VHKTAPMILEPEHLGMSDWVLDRQNQNPFRAGTREHGEYEAGYARAARG
jgi:hypothetical protein